MENTPRATRRFQCFAVIIALKMPNSKFSDSTPGKDLHLFPPKHPYYKSAEKQLNK